MIKWIQALIKPTTCFLSTLYIGMLWKLNWLIIFNNGIKIIKTLFNAKQLLPGAARLTFGQHYGSDSTTTPTIPKSTATTTTTTTTASSQPEEVPNNELEFGSESATQSAQRRGDVRPPSL